MTVTREGTTVSTFKSVGVKLKNRFIYKLIVIYVSYYTIMLFVDPYIWSNFVLQYTILVLGPLFCVWYVEKNWTDRIKKNQMVLQYEKIKNLRFDFYVTGIIVSILMIFISQAIVMLVGNLTFWSNQGDISIFEIYNTNIVYTPIGRNMFIPSFFLIFVYLMVLSAALVIVAYKLLFTRFNGPDKLKNRLFDHPSVGISLLSYFFLGSILSSIILYAFQDNRYFQNRLFRFEEGQMTSYQLFQYSTFASSLPFIFMIPLFITVLISFYLIIIPYFLKGRNIDLRRNSDKISIFGIGAIGIPFVFSYILNLMFANFGSNPSNLYILNLFGMILGLIGLLAFVRQSFTEKQQCQNCGYYGGTDCKYCHGNNKEMEYEVTGINLKVPRCPNCSKEWNNLTRRCSNCKYTIVLTCENCSQTINPLWKKCNLCGTPRMPVPEIALTRPTDTRFTQVRSTLILWIIMTIPVMITDVVLFYGHRLFFSQFSRPELASIPLQIYFFDNYRRWVIWTIWVLTITYLVMKTTQDNKNNQRLLVFNHLIRIVFSEIFIYFLVFTLVMLFSGFSNSENVPIFFYLMTLIPVGIIGVIYYRRYKTLMSFDPYSIYFKNLEEVQQ